MPLQTTIDTIRDRLARGIFKNEAEVRQGIVNELLRELGWSLGDTTVVCPEYSIEGGRVDYALCCPPQKPVALIEVKNIGKIDSRSERQLFSYAFHAGVPILVLTDGQQWQFFYTFGQGDYEDRRVCVLDLRDSDSEKNVDGLQRYLRYPSIENKAAIQAIESDYRLLSSQRDAERHLPEVWQDLLADADGLLIELVAEATESICGHRPSEAQVLSFLKNLEGGGTFSVLRELTSPLIESVPEAWHGLLVGADGLLIELVAEATESICGHRPSEAQVLDFLKNLEGSPMFGEFPPKPIPSRHPPSPDPRLRSRSPRKEKYTAYFQELIDQLREQHDFTKARHAMKGQNYYSFASGFTGIKYVAGFNKQQTAYMRLRIHFGDREENKSFFDVLEERKAEITAQFDDPLCWKRRDDILRCHIDVYREGTIDSDASVLEALRAWHIENLLKFKAVFTPEIERARETLKSQ